MEKNDELDSIYILNNLYSRLDSLISLPENEVVELDLGCGKGLFTSELAKQYPKKTILAADVMIGRLKKLQKRNQRLGIENLFCLRVEARSLVSYMLADSSLDRMHLLCPDPWPKDKHKHHRLLCSDFMAQIHRVLKKNACFHFATDEDRYFEAAGRLLDNCGLFVRDDSTIDDVRDIKTDFEIRWNEQGKIVHHGSWKALK